MDPYASMPPTPPMNPPTSPPQKARRPINLANLPPQIQQQLAQGQPWQAEDGSVIYPDGTAEGAGDSPDDFVGGGMAAQGYDMQPGAWGANPPTSPQAAPADPLANPVFDRYKTTVANAAPWQNPPTAPDQVIGNPLGEPGFPDPLGDLTAQQDTRQPITINNGAQAAEPYGAGPEQTGPRYGGRVGRRMVGSVSSRPMGPRRRR